MSKVYAKIVVDYGFGDAGKGGIVDFLAREAGGGAVVRFNGGAQAAHNVITPDGRHHTFSQFGSGTFVPGMKTHLSRFMLIDPPAMVEEAGHLAKLGCGDVFSRLSVDRAALVVTPFQKAANRIREVLRGADRHGSCGMGIGETMADMISFPKKAVYAADLRDEEVLVRKFARIQKLKWEEFRDELNGLSEDFDFIKNEVALLQSSSAPRWCARSFIEIARRFKIVSGTYLGQLALKGPLIFEGAQGVLIDEWHGFHPYTTWSTTTFDNALSLLREIDYQAPIEKIGVLRAYHTRHGPGPFVTEQVGLSLLLPDQHNSDGRWQGGFRIGWFDSVMARYANTVAGGADSLAVTCLDRLWGVNDVKIATSYQVPLSMIDHTVVQCGFHDVRNGTFIVQSLNEKSLLTDLLYQERLTKLLGHVSPVYEKAPESEGAYLMKIEQEVGLPVSITSHGRTAIDKSYRSTLRVAS